MMVIGVDPHKRSHTAAGIDAGTGELRSSETVAASSQGLQALLDWACGQASERCWAIEDCRHVSGRLERMLIDHGERVVRVAPALTGPAHRHARQAGKSDPIDALAVARAAVREGLDTLPTAYLDEHAMEIKVLIDHRDQLVHEHTQLASRLRWHLHQLLPELEIPTGALDRPKWLELVARRLRRLPQHARVRVARSQLTRLVAINRQRRALERELAPLVIAKAPQLLARPGLGVLIAARIIAETAGAQRFATDAKFAQICGAAPIPASSGQTNRHRLNRGGNRALNCALHRIAIIQGQHHPPARDYLARKQAQGKTRKEAIRALKRHLARAIWHDLHPHPLT